MTRNRELADEIEPGLDPAVLRRRREVQLWSRPSNAEPSTLTRDAVRERFPNGHVLQFSAIDEMTFHQQSDSTSEVKGRVVAISQDGQQHVSTCLPARSN